jgi:imidazolonepropionase-like amidohydrolase
MIGFMRTVLRCGALLTGTQVLRDQDLHVENGVITAVEPIPASATRRSSGTSGAEGEVVDCSRAFVMPGMVDVHVHLAYGNAKTEEDIDLYASQEFRAIRGMFFAGHVLRSGVTSIGVPGGSGHIGTAVRDAIDAGLFRGPRVTAAGPYITSRQGLTDWYPSWIGAPSSSIGRLVRSPDEAIEEIRRQVKDGVDAVKLALDGIQRRPDGEHIAAFTAEETVRMVDEIHRLGRTAIAHARGREAVLYAAKAGVDLIFHASYLDDEGLSWVLANGCAISPSLTLIRNMMDLLGPADPYVRKGRREACRKEYDAAVGHLRLAREAGVPMPVGTDTGFAVTPYGEWHGREAQIYVEDLGFSPLEALVATTSGAASVLRPKDRSAGAAVGDRADLVALDANPLEDISVLSPEHIVAVWKDGSRVEPRRPVSYEPSQVSDFAMTMYADLHTRSSAALGRSGSPEVVAR